MNRNVNSRFALNPTNIDMPRSKFSRAQSIKTTFNIGDIIPFYVDEVLPGDTMQVETSKLIRMQTLVAPIMDNIYLDTYYFFVPNRLVWEHWKEFMGENTTSSWIPQAEYSIPQLLSPINDGWKVGSIADYMGIPTGVAGLSVNALPFRAYALICNEWFRDENLTEPLNIPTNDSDIMGLNPGNGDNPDEYIDGVARGGAPFKASKYFDYFTGALPAPQKGPDIGITLNGFNGSIPVVGNGYTLALTNASNTIGGLGAGDSYGQLKTKGTFYGKTLAEANGAISGNSILTSGGLGVATYEQIGNNPEYSGLIADLSNLSGEAIMTINQLRQAFQIQKFYEKSARGGTRYIELLKSMFGVTSPDARLQRPEYLGGNRINVNINQVVQTSETGSTPMGDTAAYSLTSDAHDDFTHSFVEHGFLIGVMVARYDHTYQQGIERFWNRTTKFDYYWPLFANLGEQPILNKEILAVGTGHIDTDTGKEFDDEVFGYQEAWADYRYKPNRVSGEMRSTSQTPLDMWHLADYYTERPYLSDEWIREDKTNLDRALAVTSSVSMQLFGDIYVKNVSTRAMPVYSIPGLIDHH